MARTQQMHKQTIVCVLIHLRVNKYHVLQLNKQSYAGENLILILICASYQRFLLSICATGQCRHTKTKPVARIKPDSMKEVIWNNYFPVVLGKCLDLSRNTIFNRGKKETTIFLLFWGSAEPYVETKFPIVCMKPS